MTISDLERNNFKQNNFKQIQITKIQYITMHDLALFKAQSPQTAPIPGRAYVALAFFRLLKGPKETLWESAFNPNKQTDDSLVTD